jgi:DNA polymerase-3 subunit epsilon
MALALREVKLVVVQATAEELEAHEQQLEMIERESKGKCIWRKLESEAMLEAATYS